MAKKNLQRERFKTAFGYLFTDCSDTMVQKCWIAAKRVPDAKRALLIHVMLDAARARVIAAIAAEKSHA